MLGTTLTVTINAVAKVLNRVTDDGYAATYFLSEATRDYTLSVKHTVPKVKGASKESHLLRLDINDYDAVTGAVIRKSSVWTVLETSTGSQNDTDMGYYRAGLSGLLDATLTTKILQRMS